MKAAAVLCIVLALVASASALSLKKRTREHVGVDPWYACCLLAPGLYVHPDPSLALLCFSLSFFSVPRTRYVDGVASIVSLVLTLVSGSVCSA